VHNTLAMSPQADSEQIATLWQLAWEDTHVLACHVYRDAAGFEMRVESNGVLIAGERCELQPRAIARAQALRVSLVRRGWRDQH
jgi:hypothetical protein